MVQLLQEAKVQIYFGLPRPPHNVYIFTPPTRPTCLTCPTCPTCLTRPTCPTSLISLPVRLALSPITALPALSALPALPFLPQSSIPLALSKKIFSLLLHYSYDIQTIQEERTKSEKSAKYKHLIKVSKVVCFTFQLF